MCHDGLRSTDSSQGCVTIPQGQSARAESELEGSCPGVIFKGAGWQRASGFSSGLDGSPQGLGAGAGAWWW